MTVMFSNFCKEKLVVLKERVGDEWGISQYG